VALLATVNGIRWTRRNEDGNPEIRIVRIVRGPPINPNTFEVRAVKKEIGTRNLDAVQFLFSTNTVPRFVLRYFTKDADSSEFLMNRWSLWKVFEYSETDGEAGFNPEVESFGSSYILFNRNWDRMDYHKETVDGVIVHYVCTDLDSIVQPAPDVRLCAHVAEQETEANRSRIHPNSLKWSVTLANYPYTNITNPRLGLKVSFDSRDVVRDLSETDADLEDVTDEAALDLNSDQGDAGTPRSVASWTTTVAVTGTGCSASADVVRTVLLEAQRTNDRDTYPPSNFDSVSADFKLRVSYFSFDTDCTPDSITWDPELGVALDDSSAGSLSAGFLLVVMALLASLML